MDEPTRELTPEAKASLAEFGERFAGEMRRWLLLMRVVTVVVLIGMALSYFASNASNESLSTIGFAIFLGAIAITLVRSLFGVLALRRNMGMLREYKRQFEAGELSPSDEHS